MAANYAALQAAWATSSASSGALPTGVTGTSLFGLTTAAKLAAINGWTVVGPAIPANLSPSQIFNCIDTVAHANAVTALQWAVMQFLAGSGQPIAAPPGSTVRAWFSNAFAGQTTTLANLAALIAQFDSPPIPWATATAGSNGGGLSAPISANDLVAAGGLA